jgi:hypothetical protein
MEATGTRQYAIQVQAEDGDWADAYTSADQAEAEKVWQRMRDAGLRRRARLVALDVMNDSSGSPAA